ncbi:hypothetical protein BABA_20531 [Neobacillus bataviensis LMG 21833]|uniref:Uncharacterized protein n=1 Tax=Neobacillus bataviensis LMG 21833 TaxID=1117379 RepID=K6DBF2_9BACI|nr:hypothetical protein [Neobacillus bataviensis]EKN65398.1 hypothetical protein BABA_20531 [Neobacillus bataviensis LMG 21833]
MENIVQEEKEEKSSVFSETRAESQEYTEQDRFTSFMFGSRRELHQRNHPHHQHQEPEQNQSTINYEELMMNIDTLYESVRGLKPLFDKIYPVIEQFWKKK